MQSIDLSGLFPSFFPEFLTSWPAGTAEGMSDFFVALLLLLFVLFLGFLIRSTYKAWSSVSGLSRCLENESEGTVFLNRKDLLHRIREREGPEKHLWEEFDETLIEKIGEQKLFNVYDADYFFNASTLAPGITESRLLAAVPGFLTAIGVVGTFVGLQLGLSELNIGNDVAVEEMKAGLAHVISGAKLAFKTSVWGVLLSVFFNLIEKSLENSIRKK